MKDKSKLMLCVFLSFFLILFVLFMYSQAEELVNTAKSEDKKEETKLLVDLDLKDVDIRDAARALARISGKNIIVSEDVKTKVTLRVKDVDWREALDMILGAYNLAVIEKEDYIVITTLEKRRLAEESGDLKTQIVRFNFANVEEIQKTLSSMLTRRGKTEVDVRSNSLVITDIPERIDKIREVGLQLDIKTPQVMIEAMMLTVKLNDDAKLGVYWDIIHKTRGEREFKQDLDIGGSSGSDYFWQIKYGKTLLSWANLSAIIDFLVEEKKAEILANPRVLTLDNLAANIKLTEQVPYTQQVTSTESSSSVASTQFKDVPVTLSVKPHITKDNYIFMNIITEQSYRSGYTPDSQPIIDSRKAETNVMVKDGETVVIGGLIKKEDTVTRDKMPVLGDIPLLGHLFRKTVRAKVNTELIIFVTPHLATEAMLTEKERKRWEEAKEIKAGKRVLLFDKQVTPFPLRPPLENK